MRNTVADLHVELVYIYHRVCVKLAASEPGEEAALSVGRDATGASILVQLRGVRLNRPRTHALLLLIRWRRKEIESCEEKSAIAFATGTVQAFFSTVCDRIFGSTVRQN